MSDEMFEAILTRIAEQDPDVKYVRLFNWTEPLLHPRLPELIGLAWKHGMGCYLSTNLNFDRRLEEVVRAEPRRIRISVSGYTQEKYSRTHERGEIDKVIENMRRIRRTIDQYRLRTKVDVPFHCYVDNVEDDYPAMRELCRELRFIFEPCWAFLMPIEKNLEYFSHGLPQREQVLVDLLAVKPEEAREISLRQWRPDCDLRSNQTVINCDGSVALCCGTYDAEFTVADSFLDVTKERLQEVKDAHSFCATCMKEGLHVTLKYGAVEEWNKIASRRIGLQSPPTELEPDRRGRFGRLAGKVKRALTGRHSRI
jgi:hypothetical protein